MTDYFKFWPVMVELIEETGETIKAKDVRQTSFRNRMTRILLTGGCGFIGHHFVEHFLKNTDLEIVVLDRLTYASNGFDRLRDIRAFDDKRVRTLAADFTKPFGSGLIQEIGGVDYIFHLGAETHVDNSIKNPELFVETNVLGTCRMLEFARSLPNLKCFFYFSTDEVLGPAPAGVNFKEGEMCRPTNPYSASKAGGEMLVMAYANTYKVPTIITRTMNVFGERQHPEKFIPMTIKKVLAGEKVIIHSDITKTKAGSRFWIHARNVASAYQFLLEKGQIGEIYHIAGEREVDNLEMAKTIAAILRKDINYEMVDFHSSRPGHDLRYALDDSKIKNLGWSVPVNFDESLKKTIEWCLKDENKRWLEL